MSTRQELFTQFFLWLTEIGCIRGGWNRCRFGTLKGKLAYAIEISAGSARRALEVGLWAPIQRAPRGRARWGTHLFAATCVGVLSLACGDAGSDLQAGDRCARSVQCADGLACVMGLCSSDIGALADAASPIPIPEQDAGLVDGATSDGQAPSDTGVPVDSGVMSIDSGPAPADAGPAPVDAGPAPDDSGPQDGGGGAADAGPTPADAGPLDSGAVVDGS